jgi:hypothetical protein
VVVLVVAADPPHPVGPGAGRLRNHTPRHHDQRPHPRRGGGSGAP